MWLDSDDPIRREPITTQFPSMMFMNKRIESLRKRYVERERKVDNQRAVIITEAYKKNEDKPPIIAKALALKAIFSQMSIAVREDELIVGKLDQQRIPHGTILNQRFHPSVLDGENQLRMLTRYIRTFMDLGGLAQPDKCGDLRHPQGRPAGTG